MKVFICDGVTRTYKGEKTETKKCPMLGCFTRIANPTRACADALTSFGFPYLPNLLSIVLFSFFLLLFSSCFVSISLYQVYLVVAIVLYSSSGYILGTSSLAITFSIWYPARDQQSQHLDYSDLTRQLQALSLHQFKSIF